MSAPTFSGSEVCKNSQHFDLCGEPCCCSVLRECDAAMLTVGRPSVVLDIYTCSDYVCVRGRVCVRGSLSTPGLLLLFSSQIKWKLRDLAWTALTQNSFALCLMLCSGSICFYRSLKLTLKAHNDPRLWDIFLFSGYSQDLNHSWEFHKIPPLLNVHWSTLEHTYTQKFRD